jgi:dihydroorotase
MSIYLTKDICPDEIYKIKSSKFILSAKFYPKGATTNSAHGISNFKDLYPHFQALEDINAVLQIHGEVTNQDIFDREKIFIEKILEPIIKDFPNLRIVLEHISTQEACEFVANSSPNLAATITPQHLLFNRNHLLAGGIKPHLYCLPILKTENDQKALLKAACSGNPKFFAGTDSAPHAKSLKENACGCAGIYSAPFAVSLYAEAFSKNGAIDKLESFLSKFGAEYYQLPHNTQQLELINKPFTIPDFLPFANDIVIPLAAGQTLQWSVIDDTN